MFASTKRFSSAVTLINGTPSARFPHLLSRVLGRLHAKAERVFSPAEDELCILVTMPCLSASVCEPQSSTLPLAAARRELTL